MSMEIERREAHLDVVEARRRAPAGQLLDERPPQVPLDVAIARLDRRPEDGLALEQRSRHPVPLRPLTREHEDDSPRSVDGVQRARVDRGTALPCEEARERTIELRVRARDDGQPLRRPAAARRPLCAEGRERRAPSVRSQGGPKVEDRRPERLRALGGDGEDLRPRGRPLLEYDVAVGAAQAEGADPGDQALLRGGPGAQGRGHREAQLCERGVRVRRLEIEVRRQLTVLDRQSCLEEAHDAGRSFEVSDVGLCRADEKGEAFGAPCAQHGPERPGLDGIAERRARPVGLDVLDRRQGHPGAAIGGAQHRLLRPGIGSGHPVAGTVVVDGAAANHTIDGIPIGHRAGQRLEDGDPAPLASDVAVGAGIERITMSVRRERAEAGHPQRALRRHVEVDGADQRQRRLSPTQAITGEVGHGEPGRARGVERQARPLEAEAVGDPVGDDAVVIPGDGVLTERFEAPVEERERIIEPDGPREDRRRGAIQRAGPDPGVLDRLPAQLEHEPLLRIHLDGLPGRDAEEERIELVDPVEEPPASNRGPLRPADPVSGEDVVPPPVAGHLGDRVDPFAQQPPECRWVGGHREAAGHPDDGDGLLGVVLRHDLARAGGGLVAPRQVPHEGVDGGILPHQGRRKASSQDFGQLGDEAPRPERVEPLTGEPLPNVDALRVQATHGGEVRDEPSGEALCGKCGHMTTCP